MSYRLNCQNLTKILSRNRSQSPSRIPVVPAAELHRRNSQKHLNGTKGKSPVASPQKIRSSRPSLKGKSESQPNSQPTSKKDPPKNRGNDSKNPVSLADSGFVSSHPSKNGIDHQREIPLGSSTKALNQNISDLETRRREKRKKKDPVTHQPDYKDEIHYNPNPTKVNQPVIDSYQPSNQARREPNSSAKSSRQRSSSNEKMYEQVRRASFGVNAAPILRSSETQTEAERKPIRKFHSMSDVRKSRNSRQPSIYSDSSHTDAETVVANNRRQRRSQSPRMRRSRDDLRKSREDIRRSREDIPKTSRIDFIEPDDNSIELEELRNEIARLKERMESRNNVEPQKPIIKTPVQSDSESKQIKLFSKLKNEVQKLRDEVMKVKSKRVVTDTSSLVETDSTIGYQPSDSNNRKRSTQQQQAQNKPLPSNPVQVNIPNQHPQVQPQAVPISQGYPPGYIAYPEGVPPSGIFMPFWVLPNKRGMIAASSVPNLSTFQQESPKKTKKYRIETDSETPYMSDVDYRSSSRKKKPGKFYPSNEIMIYDDQLDQRLRKAERAAEKVSDRSSKLMKKAKHKTPIVQYYGYI